MKNKNKLALGMAIGIAIGSAIGVALGAGIGSRLNQKKKNQDWFNCKAEFMAFNYCSLHIEYYIYGWESNVIKNES